MSLMNEVCRQEDQACRQEQVLGGVNKLRSVFKYELSKVQNTIAHDAIDKLARHNKVLVHSPSPSHWTILSGTYKKTQYSKKLLE